MCYEDKIQLKIETSNFDAVTAFAFQEVAERIRAAEQKVGIVLPRWANVGNAAIQIRILAVTVIATVRILLAGFGVTGIGPWLAVLALWLVAIETSLRLLRPADRYNSHARFLNAAWNLQSALFLECHTLEQIRSINEQFNQVQEIHLREQLL